MMVSCGLIGFSGLVHAVLPQLKDEPWLGYFAVYQDSHFDFTVTGIGEVTLIPKNKDKEPMAIANCLRIDYGIEELKSDGTVVFKKIDEDSLESTQTATAKLQKVVIRGKTTGGAAFELVIEQSRGLVSMGGGIVDVGRLKKYPLRFVIRANIPNVYARTEIEDKQDKREFRKKTSKDSLFLKQRDGTRKTYATNARDDDSMKTIGLSEYIQADVELSYFEGRKFTFIATPKSTMRINNRAGVPRWNFGFSVNWTPDAEKDSDHQSRFQFSVR
jgi:hypothetical protein